MGWFSRELAYPNQAQSVLLFIDIYSLYVPCSVWEKLSRDISMGQSSLKVVSDFFHRQNTFILESSPVDGLGQLC